MVLASGGQDGAICLWDVLTGSRVSHVYGHRGDVTSLVCTTSCVISSGLDDLICIWDRSTGIKLYSIQQVLHHCFVLLIYTYVAIGAVTSLSVQCHDQGHISTKTPGTLTLMKTAWLVLSSQLVIFARRCLKNVKN